MKSWQKLSDEDLARQVRDADSHEAFDELTLRYRRRLEGFLRKKGVANPDDVQELVQETLCRAYTALRGGFLPNNVRDWLLLLANRRRIDWLRRQKREEGQREPGDETEEVEGPIEEVQEENLDHLPEPAYELQEVRQILQEALEILSPLERTIVLEHVVNERSFRELAEMLQIPCTTIHYHYHQALPKLRAYLEGKGLSYGAILP
jgi:RNA polymerase sigma-70 factor (ECF subfamily)